MFNKIAMIDNKIAIVKYVIEWQESIPVGFDEEGSEEQFKSEVRSDWAISEADKERIVQSLDGRGVEYKITPVDIPQSVQVHDNEQWVKSREEAILYINGIGEYNPLIIQINSLKQQLSETDYKAIKYAEGLIDEAAYQTVKQLRQNLREQISNLESML